MGYYNKFIRDSRKSMCPYPLALEFCRKYQVYLNSGMGLCSCLNILYIFYWILPWNVSFSRLEKWEKYLIKDNFVLLIERKTTSNKIPMSLRPNFQPMRFLGFLHNFCIDTEKFNYLCTSVSMSLDRGLCHLLNRKNYFLFW